MSIEQWNDSPEEIIDMDNSDNVNPLIERWHAEERRDRIVWGCIKVAACVGIVVFCSFAWYLVIEGVKAYVRWIMGHL
jgi:hypothetical protein